MLQTRHTSGKTQAGTILSIGIVRDEEDRDIIEVVLFHMSGDGLTVDEQYRLTQEDIKRLQYLLRETS